MIKKYGQDEYDFSIRETQTYEIIEDVAKMNSELGIIFMDDFNDVVLNKILKPMIWNSIQLYSARPPMFS